jgi:hypothetical protein
LAKCNSYHRLIAYRAVDATLLDDGDNANVIKANLHDAGIKLNDHQAWAAAHEISDKVWALHTYFGYTLAALLNLWLK